MVLDCKIPRNILKKKKQTKNKENKLLEGNMMGKYQEAIGIFLERP